MNKEKLGSTNLLVTPIGAGCAPLGGLPYAFGHQVDEAEGIAVVKKVLRSEINFIDTASNYGRAEERIGKAIKEIGGLPEGIVIATKADRYPNNGTDRGSADADQIQRCVEASLRKLGLDHLPLVYLHDPEYFTQSFEEVMADDGAVKALLRFKDQGVIGNIGISGGPIDMMTGFINTGAFDVVITHNRYTLLNRTAEPLINLASEKGMGVVNAAIFGGGVLVKGLQGDPRYAYHELTPEIVEKIKKIEKICREFNIPIGAAALQFSRSNPRINSTIVGFSSPAEVDEVLSFTDYKIPDEVWSEISQFAIYDQDPER